MSWKSKKCIIGVVLIVTVFCLSLGTLTLAQTGIDEATAAIDKFLAARFPGKVKPYKGVTIRVNTIREVCPEVALKILNESNFEEKTGIRVEFVLNEFDVMVETETMDFLAGTGTYDVVGVDQPSLGKYVEAGWIYSLDEFIQDPVLPNVYVEDFIPAVFDPSSRWKEKIYTFPLGAYGNLYGYRKDLFKKYGIARPPETFEEMLGIAVMLNAPPDRYGMTAYAKRGEFLSYDAASYLWAWGSGFIDVVNKRILFDNDAGMKALEFYSNLFLKWKVVPPGSLYYGHPEFTDSVRSGLCATGLMIQEAIGAPMEDPKVSKVPGKIGYAVVPGKRLSDGTIRRHGCIGSHALAINADSKNKEAAYVVAWFLTSKEIQKEYGLRGGRPVRFSAYEYPEVLKKYPEYKTVKEALPIGGCRPNIPEYPAVSEIFSTALHEVLSEIKPLEAMHKAAEEATKILKEAYPEAYK